MGGWVITVAGIAILAVLCDVIMPDGQTRKYIKTVVGIIVTLVMLQPIVNFVGGGAALDLGYSQERYDVELQQSYLEMTGQKRLERERTELPAALDARGIDVTEIDVDGKNKTVVLQTGSTYSESNKRIIDGLLKIYFDNYDITIKWK